MHIKHSAWRWLVDSLLLAGIVTITRAILKYIKDGKGTKMKVRINILSPSLLY